MKTDFLKELGIEQDAINKIMAENCKDIAAEQAKTTQAEADRDKYKEQLDTATSELDKFKDIKPDELRSTIDSLKNQLQAKEDEYRAKEAERAFAGDVENAIKAAGGRNTKAVMALLDLEALKASKNQKEDISSALENVKKENGYMFGSTEPIMNPTGPIGNGGDDKTSALRAAMGLPSEETK